MQVIWSVMGLGVCKSKKIIYFLLIFLIAIGIEAKSEST